MKLFVSVVLALACVTIVVGASLERTHVDGEEEQIEFLCSPHAENTTISAKLQIEDLINKALNEDRGIKVVVSASGPVGWKFMNCGNGTILETVQPTDFEEFVLEKSWISYLKEETKVACPDGSHPFMAELIPNGHCSARLSVTLDEKAKIRKDSPDSTNFTFPIQLAENQTTLLKVSMGNALEKGEYYRKVPKQNCIFTALHAPHLPHHPSTVSLVSETNAPVLFRVEKCGFTQTEMHPILHSFHKRLTFGDVAAVLRMHQLRCSRKMNQIYLRVTAGRPTKGRFGFQFETIHDNSTTTTTEPTTTTISIQTTGTTKATDEIDTRSSETVHWITILLCLFVVAALVAALIAVFIWKRRSPRLEPLSFSNPVVNIPLEDLTIY